MAQNTTDQHAEVPFPDLLEDLLPSAVQVCAKVGQRLKLVREVRARDLTSNLTVCSNKRNGLRGQIEICIWFHKFGRAGRGEPPVQR